MKILVLQLARFGDIYMTWPLLRALRRNNPNSEIHYLARKRFSEALTGLTAVDKVLELPSQAWAESLISEVKNDSANFSNSVGLVDKFIDKLKSENYDKIINLSFSPLSSFITHALETKQTECLGYSRFNDGTFRCLDPVSIYFYDQVGEIRSNRFHLTDVMAAMIGVDLIESDFQSPVQNFNFQNECHPQKTILLHVGASQRKKSLAGFQWGRIVKAFLKARPEFSITLIGSPQEKYIAEEILAHNPESRIISYVGATTVPQVFDLLKNAHSLIACDSMAIHMASLTNTPCFNISFKSVNFWETGPLSSGSVVCLIENPESINSYALAEKWSQFVTGGNPEGVFYAQKSLPRFIGKTTDTEDFQWKLLQSLYLNEPFPVTEDGLFCECVDKVYQLNNLLIENLKKLKDKSYPYANLLLDQTENTLMSLGKYHGAIDVILRWYRGKKVMVPPLKKDEIINEYLKIHLEFRSILKMYLWTENETQTLKKE